MMSKNTFFDLHRFINLCRKEMVEGWKVNLLRMLLMYGALTVFFIFLGFIDYERATTLMKDPVVEGSLRVFLVAGCIYGCISASLIMERMKTKAGRFSFLMLPATSFEKYVARWLVFTVVFVVAYLVAFELADYTRVVVCSLSFPDVKGITPTSLRLLFLWNDGNEIVYQSASDVLISVCSYLFLQSFCNLISGSPGLMYPRPHTAMFEPGKYKCGRLVLDDTHQSYLKDPPRCCGSYLNRLKPRQVL